jgi:protein transport protein SEC31
LPTIGQWCFDLSWSRRNPDLVCASSFEGQVNVYTLMGGKYNVIQQTSSKIMDSFGDVPNTPPATSQQQQITQQIPQLKIAPKWLKRPCGARFAFGGKLVTFGRTALTPTHLVDGQNPDPANQQAMVNNQRVSVSQVINVLM